MLKEEKTSECSVMLLRTRKSAGGLVGGRHFQRPERGWGSDEPRLKPTWLMLRWEHPIPTSSSLELLGIRLYHLQTDFI